MVQATWAFLEFCYIARRDILDTKSLSELEDALKRYHAHCKIFQECGVRADGFTSAKPFFNLYNFRQLFHAFTTCN